MALDRAQLEDFRRRAEQLQYELSQELYANMAGLQATSNVSAVYRKYPELSEKSLVTEVRHAMEAEADPAQKRRLAYLLDMLVENILYAETKESTDRRLTEESQRTVVVDGQEIPFRNTWADLAREPGRERRERILRARLAVVEELSPIILEILRRQYAAAKSLGFPNYVSMVETLSGVDLTSLAGVMDEFLVRTQDVYREVFRFVARKYLRLEPQQVAAHDLGWLFRGASFDAHFPAEDLMAKGTRFLREMAIEPSHGGRIAFDLEERAGKSSRAFCVAVQVPRKILLVMSPTGGHEDYSTFLHELGHAQQLAHVNETLPFEFRHLGDYGVSESYAFLFQNLLHEEGWLSRYLDYDRPKDYLLLAWFKKLYLFRRYAAKLNYELLLHREQAPETSANDYHHILSAALGVSVPKELYLYDLDPGFVTARYIRAWLFDGQLHRHLVHYFDEDWYRNPSAGAYLANLWSAGHSITLEELAERVGVKRADFGPVVEDFEKHF